MDLMKSEFEARGILRQSLDEIYKKGRSFLEAVGEGDVVKEGRQEFGLLSQDSIKKEKRGIKL